MADSITSVSGLVSGIQWRDLVDQLSQVDQSRELDPITQSITAQQKRSGAWASYQLTAQRLQTAAVALRDGTSLNSFLATAAASPTTGRALMSATASTGAVAGTYQVEVLSLARAEKLSGSAFASASAAASLAGDFAVNGRKVSIAASDSLNAIRDKINAVNSGTFASGVTATVLSTANGSSRLVLSSDAPGARGIELLDSSASGGVVQQLGLVDASLVNPSGTTGSATSGGFSSTEIAVGQMLGMSYPAPASIKVGNRTIMLDLERDSLSDLVAKLQAAGIGARTTTTTENGVARSRLQIDAGVSAIPSTNDPTVPDAGSMRTLQMLGMLQGGRSAIAQSVGSTALTDGGGAVASASTLLTDLSANGASANIGAGDQIVFNGRRGDGTAVSLSFAVAPGSTMSDVLAQLNGPSAFGGGSRGATASIGTDGKIHLADGIAGDSQLSLAMSVNKGAQNGGGTTGIGAFGIETVGRVRAVTSGSDAQLRVDGVLMSRSTNNVSDAITGVTLALQQAEVGTTVNVEVKRDTTAALTSAKSLATAYNELIDFVRTNTASGGALAYNSTLKASAAAFTRALLADVVGSSLARPTLAGITLDKAGQLSVDATVFNATLQVNPEGMKSLFALSGSVAGPRLEYIGAGDRTAAGNHEIVVTALATVPSLTGAGSIFPFDANGATRHLSVTDTFSGTSDSITLAGGDDASAIATKLNAMFTSRSMRLTASVSAGQLRIEGTQYGSSAGFRLAYDVGDSSSAAQLGLAAGMLSGSDISGTIDGKSAIGSGQLLTGAAGESADGLVVRYLGSATGGVGRASITVGVGATFARLATGITRAGDGTAPSNMATLDESITRLRTRSSEVIARLDRRKQAMLKQFASMESAMSRIQQQGARISASLTALSNPQR